MNMDNKLTSGNLRIKNNSEEFWENIRQLRNHPNIKGGFIKQENISLEDHRDYMEKHSSCFYVCLYKNKFAGYVGCIDNDIRVATHPNFQGIGVGKFMINEIMKKNPEAVAKVKLNNTASMNLFESCGFVKRYYLLERI